MRSKSRLIMAVFLLLASGVSAGAQVEKVAARSARPL